MCLELEYTSNLYWAACPICFKLAIFISLLELSSFCIFWCFGSYTLNKCFNFIVNSTYLCRFVCSKCTSAHCNINNLCRILQIVYTQTRVLQLLQPPLGLPLLQFLFLFSPLFTPYNGINYAVIYHLCGSTAHFICQNISSKVFIVSIVFKPEFDIFCVQRFL